MTTNGIPQSKSNLTMQKEMIHRLLASIAHATSVYQNNMTLLEIIQNQNFTQRRRPCKKDQSQRSLRPLHALSREAPTFITSQRIKEGLELEETHFGRDPLQFIFIPLPHSNLMQQLEKGCKDFHFQSCASLMKLTFH